MKEDVGLPRPMWNFAGYAWELAEMTASLVSF